MFNKKDLEHYESDFNQLNITNEDTMIGILNTLDQVAEITYYIIKNSIDHD